MIKTLLDVVTIHWKTMIQLFSFRSGYRGRGLWLFFTVCHVFLCWSRGPKEPFCYGDGNNIVTMVLTMMDFGAFLSCFLVNKTNPEILVQVGIFSIAYFWMCFYIEWQEWTIFHYLRGISLFISFYEQWVACKTIREGMVELRQKRMVSWDKAADKIMNPSFVTIAYTDEQKKWPRTTEDLEALRKLLTHQV